MLTPRRRPERVIVKLGTGVLTSGAGRNENPAWAPDGVHLAFMSTRTGTEQIWTMLANGTQVKQLTTAGRNWSPVWAK